MRSIEVKRDNYLFAVDMNRKINMDTPVPEAYIFKWVNGELKFLGAKDLISFDYIKDQLEIVADQFFKYQDKLDHEGYSEDDIFQEMQAKKATA